MNKIDHVFAHGRPMDAINEPAIFESGVFGLHLFHNLLTERAHLRRTRYRHIFVAFVPENKMEEYGKHGHNTCHFLGRVATLTTWQSGKFCHIYGKLEDYAHALAL